MKIGDYGTGGTVRRRRVVQNTDKKRVDSCRCCCIIFGVIFAVVCGLWIFAEITIAQNLKTLKLVPQHTYTFPSGNDGISTLADVEDTPISYVRGVDVVPAKEILDVEFDLFFRNAAKVTRTSEYCQWTEVEHTSEEVVGQDDDGNDIVEKTTSYSYFKDWRSRRISSVFFHDSVAYHNPQRDPFPSYTQYTEAALGEMGEVSVNGEYLKHKKGVKAKVPMDLMLTNYAVNNGVNSHDGTYVYSHYDKSTIMSILHAGASFFIDGVIDLGIKGKCEAGDVRVSWTIHEFYNEMSIIGKYNPENRELVKFALGGGNEILLSSKGKKSIEEIMKETRGDYQNTLWMWRGGTVLSVLVFALSVFLFRKEKSSFDEKEKLKRKNY